MEEQGNPLTRCLTIFRRTAAKFVTTVEMTDEFGFAPPGDEFAALPAKVLIEVTEFHGGWSMTGGEGRETKRLVVCAPGVVAARAPNGKPVVERHVGGTSYIQHRTLNIERG